MLTTSPEEHNVMLTSAPADAPEWIENAGRPLTKAGVVNYVGADGTVSAEVGDGVTWLNVEDGSNSAWYGIDNSNGQFEPGSRFWVKWLSESNDSEQFRHYSDQIDDSAKLKMSGNSSILMVGVESPHGEEYNMLSNSVPFYIEIGDDWDTDDIEARFIDERADEKVVTNFCQINTPQGGGNLCELQLNNLG